MKKLLLVLLIPLIIQGCKVESDPTSIDSQRKFTAPCDNVGVVAYDVRYTADSSLSWDSWTQELAMPIPADCGMPDSVIVNMPEGEWFVAIKSRDASFNWSGRSNVVHVSIDNTPPEVVSDFR